MYRKLNWEAISNKPRHDLIEQVKTVISDHGGSILNFNTFSDLAMSLSIEVEEGDIRSMHEALDSLLSISALDSQDLKENSNKEWLIFMNLSFTKGKGDMKQEIPDVPG